VRGRVDIVVGEDIRVDRRREVADAVVSLLDFLASGRPGSVTIHVADGGIPVKVERREIEKVKKQVS